MLCQFLILLAPALHHQHLQRTPWRAMNHCSWLSAGLHQLNGPEPKTTHPLLCIYPHTLQALCWASPTPLVRSRACWASLLRATCWTAPTHGRTRSSTQLRSARSSAPSSTSPTLAASARAGADSMDKSRPGAACTACMPIEIANKSCVMQAPELSPHVSIRCTPAAMRSSRADPWQLINV